MQTFILSVPTSLLWSRPGPIA